MDSAGRLGTFICKGWLAGMLWTRDVESTENHQINQFLLHTIMITKKVFRDLRSICFGNSRFGVLDVEVAFLDGDEFDQDDKHQDVPEPVHSSIGQISLKLLRLLLGKISILLVRLASGFANQQWYFKPPELLPAWWNYSRTSPPALHPTSWLDGLRGIAALFVVFHHTSQVWLPGIRPGWGSGPDAYHIIQLPVLRIIYSGGAMVAIFFVISGYVLSTKPLQLAREGRHEELLSNLASSTFRRGPRLFIPCVVSTFITAILAMTGTFVNEGVVRHYPRAGTLWEQLGLWIHETLWLINPISGGTDFEANLWSIPVEYQGSLLIFLCALGLSKSRGAVRLGSLVCFMAYWLWFGYWATVLFLGGMLLAEMGHCRRQCASGTAPDHPSSWKSKMTLWLLVLIAIFLLSMPEYDEAVTKSYGYATLANSLTPTSWGNHWGPGRWWPCLSSIMLVALIDHAGPESFLQRLFTYRFPQYLGRISFSLYLCHATIIYTLGLRVANLCFHLFGSATSLRYGFSLLISSAVFAPWLFWISDVFTVVVDRGALTLSRCMMKL